MIFDLLERLWVESAKIPYLTMTSIMPGAKWALQTCRLPLLQLCLVLNTDTNMVIRPDQPRTTWPVASGTLPFPSYHMSAVWWAEENMNHWGYTSRWKLCVLELQMFEKQVILFCTWVWKCFQNYSTLQWLSGSSDQDLGNRNSTSPQILGKEALSLMWPAGM